jgi:hypothetical protein
MSKVTQREIDEAFEEEREIEKEILDNNFGVFWKDEEFENFKNGVYDDKEPSYDYDEDFNYDWDYDDWNY